MSPLRSARRFVTDWSLSAARALAPRLPDSSLRVLERCMARGAAHAPVLAAHVRRNMKAAGLWRSGLDAAYFEQVAQHFACAVRLLRRADDRARVAALVRSHIDVDDSLRHLRDAMALGQGAIVAAPHVCNYVLTLARLNMETPICVYLRWSKNERKRDLKHQWCKAAGVPVILEPPDHANPTSRAAACVDALREGRALVLTPDIAQKDRDKGVRVRILSTTAQLPAGPASIALLADAPIVSVFGRLEGPIHVIYAHEPIWVRPRRRDQGGRLAAVQEAMQHWSDGFDAFVRRCPQAWFLWADSRWTRVFRGDARYVATGLPNDGSPDGRAPPGGKDAP